MVSIDDITSAPITPPPKVVQTTVSTAVSTASSSTENVTQGKSKQGDLLARIKSWDVQRWQEIKVPDSKGSWLPLLIVSALFFLWGFAYGELDTINAHIKVKMSIGGDQSALMASAYYAAYLPGSFLVAGNLIRKFGYRSCFTAGLLFFGIGNLIIGGAASAFSFPAIVVGYFLVGLGIASLERSANPYVVHCGPDNKRAFRINFAQFWAAAGTVVAPQFANLILGGEEVAADSSMSGIVAHAVTTPMNNGMGKIVNMYLGVGAAVMVMVLASTAIFYRTNWVPELPLYPQEVTKRELEAPKTWNFWTHPLWKKPMLHLGMLACFFNISCQVTIAQNVMDYTKQIDGASKATGALYLTIAQALFALGRCVFTACLKFFKLKARHGLLAYIWFAILSTILTIVLTGKAGVAMVILIMFWEGPLFPSIFETATYGFGRHTLLAEDIMIASISGGSLLPPIFGKMADAVGYGKAFSLVAVFFGVVMAHTCIVNFKKDYKDLLDTVLDGGPVVLSDPEAVESSSPRSMRLDPIKAKSEADLLTTLAHGGTGARERVDELRQPVRSSPKSQSLPDLQVPPNARVST